LPFHLAGGRTNDAAHSLPLIAGLQPSEVIADQGKEPHAILDHPEAIGAVPVPLSGASSRTMLSNARLMVRSTSIAIRPNFSPISSYS